MVVELQPSIIYASNAAKVWNDFKERFDKSNLTQTYRLWKMIRSLNQGTDLVTAYYSQMKGLWDEMDLLVAVPGCDCEETKPFIEQFKNLRLLQWQGLGVIGLNESYGHLRIHVLLKTPVLTVNQAYALGTPDFKSKKKVQIQGVKSYANVVAIESGNSSDIQLTQGNFFTEDQYKQLLSLLKKQGTCECHSLMVGITSLLSNAFDCEWILDSGVSHHITFHKEIMHDIKDCSLQNNSGVQVPTGNKCKIVHTGSVSILDNQVLKDVLHVPVFMFNLLSVSKLTKELSCCAMFFPDFCVLQGLYNGKVMGIDKESRGLYLLHRRSTRATMSAVVQITQLFGT
nr:uncharacterized protein LOC104096708 [Nicotiana tomentosiformis]